MTDHFHLVVETPQPNLVAGMKWLLGTYTVRFNRRHKLPGHLFSGRYKSLPKTARRAGGSWQCGWNNGAERRVGRTGGGCAEDGALAMKASARNSSPTPTRSWAPIIMAGSARKPPSKKPSGSCRRNSNALD
jgi:hypothetical protein